MVVVKGAKHISFSDIAYIAPERYRDIEIKAERALTITNAYVLAFFDHYLKALRQPLLESAAPNFPEVTLEVYSPGHPVKQVYNGKGKSQ